MRLKKEVLRSRCKHPLQTAKFLNLSDLELVRLEKLELCENLHWLIAQNNQLEEDDGLENLRQLWHLDLSNNKLSYLYSLSKFLALGTLILSNNNLQWIHLEKLRHAHLLSISLHGNKALDSDPYYRIHVIDCLPLVWELDGRLVTVTERLHVKQFFIDSGYTEHPVRHKMGKQFQTSAIRNIGTEGVVSRECKYIYSKFPMSEKHTKHTDERRLRYLTHMVQEDILQWMVELDKKDPRRPNVSGGFLDKLLEERPKDVERCNMVMLLLVISLEFQLPTSLVKIVLRTAHIDMIGSASTMPLFLLPRAHRTRVVGVLLNAAKVDRDNHVQHEGGLYPQLFMCIYHTVAQLTRISQTSAANMHKIKPIRPNSDHIALMASEVVSLMLQVPKYFYYLCSDTGVIKLTVAATGSMDIVNSVQEKLELEKQKNMSSPFMMGQKKLTEIVLSAIQARLDKINIKMADIPVGDRYLALSDSLPIKPLHSVIWAAEFLTKGKTIPRLEPPILNPVREAAKPKPQQPKTGDKVLLGPQVVGEISMLLEGEIAMVRIDAVPVANGAVESKLKSSDGHYTFVDLKALCYAKDIMMWRPISTAGDNEQNQRSDTRYTIHSTDAKSLSTLVQQGQAVASQVTTTPLIYTPRTKTAMVYAPGALKRPQSSMLAERSISNVLIRRALSAGVTNQTQHNASFIVSEGELAEAFPSVEDDGDEEEEGCTPTITLRPSSTKSTLSKETPPTETSRLSSNMAAIVNSDTLHLHDNVHHIRGLTPREDSERSMSFSATPRSTDRKSWPRGSPTEAITSRSNSPTADNVEFPETEMVTDTQVAAPSLENAREQLPDTAREKSSNSGMQNSKSYANGEKTDVNQTKVEDEGTMTSIDILNTHKSSSQNNDNSMSPGDVDINLPVHQHQDGSGTHEALSDNCPVCQVQNTFITSVAEEKEDQENKDQPLTPSQLQEVHEEPDLPTATSKTNVDPPFNGHVKPASGGVRLRVGDSGNVWSGRPKSAVDMGRYIVITHPPSVVSTGPTARPVNNSRAVSNGTSSFKTDFQQQREEAWKRTTRSGRPRPKTAIARFSGSVIPPPQRPTSPTSIVAVVPSGKPRLRITRTDKWLGGGRDLHWEAIRRRPKSGHTPGWKEGLPESMKKRRPLSAFVSSGQWNSMRSSSGMYVSSCSHCRSVDISQPGAEGENYDLMYTQPQQISQQSLGYPISFDHQPDPLPQGIGEDEYRSGFYVQGTVPHSIKSRASRCQHIPGMESPTFYQADDFTGSSCDGRGLTSPDFEYLFGSEKNLLQDHSIIPGVWESSGSPDGEFRAGLDSLK